MHPYGIPWKDSNGFLFYQTDRLNFEDEYEEFAENKFLIFADYFDRSWDYTYRINYKALKHDLELVYAPHRCVRIAGSFNEFLELYLSDSYLLYEFPRPVE